MIAQSTEGADSHQSEVSKLHDMPLLALISPATPWKKGSRRCAVRQLLYIKITRNSLYENEFKEVASYILQPIHHESLDSHDRPPRRRFDEPYIRIDGLCLKLPRVTDLSFQHVRAFLLYWIEQKGRPYRYAHITHLLLSVICESANTEWSPLDHSEIFHFSKLLNLVPLSLRHFRARTVTPRYFRAPNLIILSLNSTRSLVTFLVSTTNLDATTIFRKL